MASPTGFEPVFWP